MGPVPLTPTNLGHNSGDSESSKDWGWKNRTHFGTRQNMPLSLRLGNEKGCLIHRQQVLAFLRFNPQMIWWGPPQTPLLLPPTQSSSDAGANGCRVPLKG